MRIQTWKEEFYNGLTHGVGLLIALVAVPALVAFVAQFQIGSYTLSAAVYGFTMLMVYASSTIYHSVPHPQVKKMLRLLDHISIYLYIAGTYTAFVVLLVKVDVAFWLILMWSLAALGIFFKVIQGVGTKKTFSVIIYSIMGGMAVFYVPPMWSELPALSFGLLVFGGLLYLIGAVIYAGKFSYNHVVWHLFVMLASAAHYAAIFVGLNSQQL